MSRSVPWRTARQQFALHRQGNDWYRIKNQHDGPTQIYIYDEIGYFGVSSADFIRDLADVNGPIDVHLNSPGGEVFDGVAIYNALLARRDVNVFIDGIAASIASVIAMAGNPVQMARQASIMIHDPFCMAIGNAQDLRDLAEQLDRTGHQISQIYSEHTGKPESYWREIMKAETWYDLQEALDVGLVDKAIDNGAGRAVKDPRDTWDLSVFRAGQRPSDAATRPWVPPTQTRHEPMTGRHTHDHAAGSATDHDDGQHSHEHEHNGDADHLGHDHSDSGSDGGQDSIRGRSHYNWDAAAALAKCHSAGDYRKVCAAERSTGDPDSREHWALPHHNSPSSGPDKGGVSAALGRLDQTDGIDKEAARKHLLAHARALGLPSGDDGGKSSDKVGWDGFSDEDIAALTNSLRGVRK